MSVSVQFGQHRPPQRALIHVSDTHLLSGDALLGGVHDTLGNLRRTLDAVERLDIRPDAIVFTGDLTDLGEPAAYEALRAVVDPVAERLGAPVVWVAGNHDERPALRRDLLGLAPTEEPVTGVWDLGGLRLVALDSSVPGWHHGDIDDDQLAWLTEVLRTRAPLGTILALHHPPIPSHVPVFGILELQHQDRLAAVLRGSDVRAILAGHLHYSTVGTIEGIPVSVAAATCYTMNLARPADAVNGMVGGAAFSLVHVYDDVVTHTVVSADDAPTGNYFSREWTAEMAALSPEERLERFSRKRG